MKIRLEGNKEEISNVIDFLADTKVSTGKQRDFESLKFKSISKFILTATISP